MGSRSECWSDTGERLEARADEDRVFLVMEFLEHDLKTLQEEMQEPFLASEIKTLMLQLTSAVDYLHDHWILHVRGPPRLPRRELIRSIERFEDIQCMYT